MTEESFSNRRGKSCVLLSSPKRGGTCVMEEKVTIGVWIDVLGKGKGKVKDDAGRNGAWY